jgi:hypothetical protein
MSAFPDDQDGYLVAHLKDGVAVWQSPVIAAFSREDAALLAVGNRAEADHSYDMFEPPASEEGQTVTKVWKRNG